MRFRFSLLFLSLAILLAGCDKPAKSFAIYAEFARDKNVLMQNGLNRRVFNTTEAQQGSNISLAPDGTITLQPGTYHLSGFSLVTTQVSLTTFISSHHTDYPGYALVYEKEYEQNDPLHHTFCYGSPSTAVAMTPSLFDLVLTCQKTTRLCVGHQSGDTLNNEVYLSVYAVDGIASPFHVFARIAIFQL